MVDPAALVNLIHEYRNTRSEESWESIRKILEPYVYFFPKRVYKAPQLFCGDFYLYIQPKLQVIISSYPLDSKYTFKTWFNQVLVNQYADFSKQYLPKDSWDYLHEDIPLTHTASSDRDIFLEYEKDGLDREELIFWKFIHYPDELVANELICLGHFTGQKMYDVLAHYYKMIFLQKARYQEKQQINANLDVIDQKILIYKERMQNLPDPALWSAKKERLKNRKARLLRSILLTEKRSHQLATELFPDPKRGARILARIKQKLRNTR